MYPCATNSICLYFYVHAYINVILNLLAQTEKHLNDCIKSFQSLMQLHTTGCRTYPYYFRVNFLTAVSTAVELSALTKLTVKFDTSHSIVLAVFSANFYHLYTRINHKARLRLGAFYSFTTTLLCIIISRWKLTPPTR